MDRRRRRQRREGEGEKEGKPEELVNKGGSVGSKEKGPGIIFPVQCWPLSLWPLLQKNLLQEALICAPRQARALLLSLSHSTGRASVILY